MFYLVAFVFMMGLTIHPDSRHMRKYLFLALVASLAQELYAFFNPEQTTLLDWVYPRMPLFQQFVLLRDFFSAIMVIVRILDSRRATEERILIESIEKHSNELQNVLTNLTKLNALYSKKLEAKEIEEKSWLTRAKG